MVAIDLTLVEYNLRQMNRDALAAFVADLWEARGFETERNGFVIGAADGRQSIRIRVVGTNPSRLGESVATSADTLVMLDGWDGSADGVNIVDASTLAKMLGYAIERPIAGELCERHFDAPPDELRRPGWFERAVVQKRTRAGFVTGVIVILFVFGTLAGLAMISGTDGAGGFATGVKTPTVDGVGSDRSANGTLSTPDRKLSDIDARGDKMPPGITQDGITDIGALAVAHERAISGRAHTIWYDRHQPRGLDPDRMRVKRSIHITAEDGRYLIRKTQVVAENRTRLGAVYHERGVFFSADWNDTEQRYHRILRMDSRNILVPTPYELRDTLVRRYLSTPESEFNRTVERNGTTLYRIVGHGTPNSSRIAEVENYSVSALVDSRGLVRTVTVEYTNVVPDENYRTRIEISYGRIGETTVTRPDWYDRRTSQDPSGANRPL